jgi:hypothetical protein
MDQLRFVETQYRLEHRHDDGSWAPMVEQPRHHSAVEHDPEHSWGIRRIFRCTRCEETATIIAGDEGAPAERP